MEMYAVSGASDKGCGTVLVAALVIVGHAATGIKDAQPLELSALSARVQVRWLDASVGWSKTMLHKWLYALYKLLFSPVKGVGAFSYELELGLVSNSLLHALSKRAPVHTFGHAFILTTQHKQRRNVSQVPQQALRNTLVSLLTPDWIL